MKSKPLGILCALVLCVILTLGLWPFHSPKNEVTWLKSANGLTFGGNGTVLSSRALNGTSSQEEPGSSIEIWVRPDRWNSSATLLAFYTPKHPLPFALGQSLTDLRLEAEVQNSQRETSKANLYISGAFGPALREKKPVFITVTAGRQRTSIYVNGALARVAPRFRILEDAFAGQVIVGDSPRQPDGFQGQIRGLAIYGVELADAQILRHYDTWTKAGRPDVSTVEHNIALYLFDEHAGKVIHNQVAAGRDLCIPDTYTVVNKIALEPFWEEFNTSQSYWRACLKNIVGFIPLGLCLYAYLVTAYPIKRIALLTVMFGATVSVAIEVLQAFLPTRDSGTTDIITNTLGTYVGVLCCKVVYPIIRERFPQMSRFGFLRL